MPVWVAALLEAFLRVFLPWMASGSTTVKVTTQPGLEGLDQKSLSGNGDLTLKDLPGIMLVCGLFLGLTGCFGTQTVHTYHLVEPGATVECVEGKVKVRDPATNDVGDYDPVGKVLLTKTTYRQLREEWIKNHPEVKVEPSK